MHKIHGTINWINDPCGAVSKLAWYSFCCRLLANKPRKVFGSQITLDKSYVTVLKEKHLLVAREGGLQI